MAKSDKQQAYITKRSRQNAAQATEDIQGHRDRRKRDLESLEAMRVSRPLKPPQRRQ